MASVATMAMETVGRTVVLIHAPGAIQDSDWTTFLSRMKQRDYDGLVIWAPGAAPNSRQRHSVRRAWGHQLPQVGVLTESATVKGVIAVFSLVLNDRIRGFAPHRLDAALEHSGTPRALQPEVKDTVARLQALVPVSNDRAFFAAIQAAHQPALRAAARALCGNDFDADDLVQETFELAFFHAVALKRVEQPRAWLKALLHHRFVTRYRRTTRESWLDLAQFEELLAPAHTEPEPPWASITMDEVWTAAAHLDAGLGRVFELYERNGLSYKEIAAQLRIPLNTVGSRLNRSRAQLRQRLVRELATRAGEETRRPASQVQHPHARVPTERLHAVPSI